MNDTGLVLEGGGMRGVYTAGVLEFFMEKEIYFPYVIGVSAGACNAASYISKQNGRNKRVTIDYIKDSRYLSYRNLVRNRSIFGMDFIFNTIPNELDPFDFNQFYNSNQKFVVGTTNCYTGEPIYFEKKPDMDILTVIRASSSLPFVAPAIQIGEHTLLDGGIADPIPIKKSIVDGNKKNVIILTKNKGYRKRPFKLSRLTQRLYPDYTGLNDILKKRYQIYNETLDYIDTLEKEKKVFILRPSISLKVKRTEKRIKRLKSLYKLGYKDAEESYNQLLTWINEA